MDTAINFDSTTDNYEPHYETTSPLKYLTTPDREIFSRTVGYAALVKSAKLDDVWAFGVTRLAREGGHILVKTETGEEKWVIDAASNDYLGLSHNPVIVMAVTEAIISYGVGAQGASMLGGSTQVHKDLENELADFLGKEAVALCASGYSMMTAACQGLLHKGDVVFYDSFCHRSLVDGMILSRSKMYQYPHNDMETLRGLLLLHRNKYRGAMIITDGVCSTNGTIAPVAELVTLSQKHNARLFVDDAHGIGTLNNGEGCTKGYPVDLVGGVLSKALGASGGFLAGSREVIDYIRFFGNANCATTNISVANAAAALAALRLIRREPERVHALNHRIRMIQEDLSKNGYTTLGTTPIISIICGSDSEAYKAWRTMFEMGILAHALPFPIVPFQQSRLRLRVNMFLDDRDVKNIVEAITQVTSPK
jgi:8-amino-7-oxononanoate synthase